MKELTLKVSPGGVRERCFMTGEQADMHATIRIEAYFSHNGLIQFMQAIIALHPTRSQMTVSSDSESNPQAELEEVPF